MPGPDIPDIIIYLSTTNFCKTNQGVIRAAIQQLMVTDGRVILNQDKLYTIKYNGKTISIQLDCKIRLDQAELARTGKRIYRVESKKLGRGTYGRGWLCTHYIDLANPSFAIPTKRLVAKVQKEETPKRDSDIANKIEELYLRAKEEAKITRLMYPDTSFAFTHLHQYYSKKLFIDKKLKKNITSVFYMPYIPGENLHEYLKNNRNLSPAKRIKIFLSFLKEIKRLHDNGYAHLDIKAQNVMYDPETEKVSLIDFGFAKKIGSSTTHSCAGTNGHFAPETTKYQNTIVDPAMDIFSAGAAGIEILYGVGPWKLREDDRNGNVSDFYFDKLNGAPLGLLHSKIINNLKAMTSFNSTRRPNVNNVIDEFESLSTLVHLQDPQMYTAAAESAWMAIIEKKEIEKLREYVRRHNNNKEGNKIFGNILNFVDKNISKLFNTSQKNAILNFLFKFANNIFLWPLNDEEVKSNHYCRLLLNKNISFLELYWYLKDKSAFVEIYPRSILNQLDKIPSKYYPLIYCNIINEYEIDNLVQPEAELKYKIYTAICDKSCIPQQNNESLPQKLEKVKAFIDSKYFKFLVEKILKPMEDEVIRLERDDGEEKAKLIREEKQVLENIIIAAAQKIQPEENIIEFNKRLQDKLVNKFKTISANKQLDRARNPVKAFFRDSLGILLGATTLCLPFAFNRYNRYFFYNRSQAEMMRLEDKLNSSGLKKCNMLSTPKAG